MIRRQQTVEKYRRKREKAVKLNRFESFLSLT